MNTAEQLARAEGEGRGEEKAMRWTKKRAEQHAKAEYKRGFDDGFNSRSEFAALVAGIFVGVVGTVAWWWVIVHTVH